MFIPFFTGLLSFSTFAEGIGRFTATDCPCPIPEGLVEGRDLRCGYVEVPEFHTNPNGRTLKLQVAKVLSLSASTGNDPLVPLPTGPGSSAIDSFLPVMASPLGSKLRENRDVVIFEQRGLFYSEKNLVCREVHEWFGKRIFENLQGWDRIRKTAAVFAECRKSLLKKDVDLNAYRYAESAEDLIMVLDALGYRKFNILGISAGTMLAQHLMKSHSDRLRSVLINSVVRLDKPLRSLWPADSARHLEKLFALCAADKACNEAYPNLGDKLERTVRKLNAEPYRIEIENPNSGKKETAFINGDRFAEHVFVAGYSTFGIPGLPAFIHSTDQGDYSKLKEIAEGPSGPGEKFAWGLGYSIFCSESPEMGDEEIRLAGLYPAFEEGVANLVWGPRAARAICELWGVDRVPVEELSLPKSSVPTLLMSGQFDSISPKELAAAVARNLTNSYEIVVPSAGHSAIESGPCSISIALAFLEDPTQKPDDSCLSQISIRFDLPVNRQ